MEDPKSPAQPPPGRTLTKTNTLYFAYGSNLSPTQMSLRLHQTKNWVSKPLAIARLDLFKWIICERGYANILPVPSGESITHDTVVWGVLYKLSQADEEVLDGYEGFRAYSGLVPNQDPRTRLKRPYEQGLNDYNKHYLQVSVTKWLIDPTDLDLDHLTKLHPYHDRMETPSLPDEAPRMPLDFTASVNFVGTTVRALVYIDEQRTAEAEPNFEYIGRMNRAIREAEGLGVAKEWLDSVLRRFIKPGIEVDDPTYVGNEEGHVEQDHA